jgi:hypothetical protein
VSSASGRRYADRMSDEPKAPEPAPPAGSPPPPPGTAGAPKAGMKRRTLLRRAALGAAIGLGALTIHQSTGYVLPDAFAAALRALSVKEALVLEAAVARILDGALDRPDPGLALEVVQFVDGYLARQAEWTRTEVKALLHGLEHSPPVMIGRASRFTRLDAEGQDAHLRAWQTSRFALIRSGWTGLKGMACMGGYRRQALLLAIGYDGLPGRGT